MTPRPPSPDGLAALWGPLEPGERPLRVLGLFAHPDDEVFCVGGTIALAAAAGAETALVSLTQGDAGQIRDSAVATRRTLGATRVGELEAAAKALGVGAVECFDLGDGNLARMPYADLVVLVREVLQRHAPDVVVTFGDDGGFGHPDHMASSRAVLSAREQLARPLRVLHARFPAHDRLLVDLLVEWLTSRERESVGTAGFGNALRLFADGSSVLGFAADHLHVQWFPAGSFVIEQGEPATELFCILSGSVDIVVEDADGGLRTVDTAYAGAFVGQDGLATNRPRNAHVIARDDVTCFVLSPRGRDLSAGRGTSATVADDPSGSDRPGPAADDPDGEDDVVVDVHAALDQKIAALVAHRSQYALDAELLPRQVLSPLLSTEYFTVVG
ncbi:Cyclic nucleotide-binding domain-containing protein [Friedmanniella luteola]|uniref:Cyclic nucleotide-binding domain-containing protein n=1 Tax=Friedmanniella luteola TaxID=546871 RepID=A0A1H1MI16_9ACTN|nr:PIG-L family deacetylase [Friedmanniella luteola]SDR86413.1 Cyclic nucleotide-binding domain-containing protein [Friedmanniella luteola]